MFNVKRALNTVICLVLIVLATSTSVHAAGYESAQSFTDVPINSTYYTGVEYLKEHDITSGVGNGLYLPDRELTAQEAVIFLCRAYTDIDESIYTIDKLKTVCISTAFRNGWIHEGSASYPETGICVGNLYGMVMNAANIKVYEDYIAFHSGIKHTPILNLEIAASFGIADGSDDPYRLATRGDIANVIYKVNTTEFPTDSGIEYDYNIENLGNDSTYWYVRQLDRIPKPIMDKFKQLGWKLSVNLDKLAGTSYSGLCSYREKTIYVNTASSIVHEIGHFMDSYLGWPSNRNNMYAIEHEKAHYFLGDYAMTNAAEYFAEYFDYYLSFRHSDKKVSMMKELTPKTYEFFYNLEQNNWTN